jgi:peroxiredoxin
MKGLTIALGALLLASGLLGQAVQPPRTHLKVGDLAPDFDLPSTKGGRVKLSDFRGKSHVVLAFFPAAFTGGCTKEMLAYQANLAKFQGHTAQVFGVSGDNTPSLGEFAKQLNLEFPLLSDFASRETMAAYGVLMPGRGLANRATFVVDRDGKIAHIQEGSAAIDVSGAEMACSRLAHR